MKRLLALSALVMLVGAPVARAQVNWPEYRGPGGDGHAGSRGLPLAWSDTQNVKWKAAVHGRGWSSPVVWGRQVWLTTATEDGKAMFVVCIDKETGKTLLDLKLFDNPNPDPVHETNSYASPSPVIEEGRVYVHFGTYGTACLDTKTLKPLWTRRDIHCKHEVGPGASPVLWKDLLLLTMDGTDTQYLIALDKKTGKTAWRADRSVDLSGLAPDTRKAFCTPSVVTVEGQPQIVCPAAQAVYAYDPRDGRELWRVRYNGFSNASRTFFGPNVAYVNTGFGKADLWAVKLGGKGDVTTSHVAWKVGRGVPQKAQPILANDLIFMIHDGGVLTCLDAATGAEVWKERIGGSYSASPLYADGRIYLFDEKGRSTVFETGRAFKKLAENALPDGFMASPAVSGKSLFLRTTTHLYRIEE